jgi:NADH-quinone oxidoreductase subunit N
MMVREDLSFQLAEALANFSQVGPELVVGGGLIVLLITDLISSGRKPLLLLVLTMLFAFVALWLILPLWIHTPGTELLFSGQLVIDRHALFSKAVVLLALVFTLLFSSGLQLRTEYYYLLLSLALGGMLMVSSVTLLSVYLTLELTSISGYVLAVFGFRKLNFEAGIKYLLFGAFASGLMLYGISLLYGLTGSLAFTSPEFAAQLLHSDASLALLAIFLTLAGVFFKIALFPMHLWTPDVYQTAPVPVAAIFSIVPKAGGLVVLLRLSASFSAVEGYEQLLIFMAAASIIFGNLAALNQTNVRRMMGYSSIAQAGFLVLPIAINDGFAATSFYFYIFIYLFMNYLAFYLVDHMEREQKFSFSDYKGLGKKHPFLAISFLVAMMALVGFPPLAGFTAKLYIFSSLWNEWQTSSSDLVLFVLLIAAANTVIALFYYLKIPYFMFLKVEEKETSGMETLAASQTITACLLVFMLVFFFVKPDSLVQIIQQIPFPVTNL